MKLGMKLGQKSVKHLVGFLGDLKTPKFYSEIDWPLALSHVLSEISQKYISYIISLDPSIWQYIGKVHYLTFKLGSLWIWIRLYVCHIFVLFPIFWTVAKFDLGWPLVLITKGQLISKCLFGVFNPPKKRTKTIRLEVP